MSITFLPLDLSGRVATNLFTNESHALIQVAGKTNRVFVCNHGAFYAASVVLRDATNRALVKGVDYKATYHYGHLSELSGKDIQGLVIITNPAVVSPVRITYQAVGGPFSISVAELKAFLDGLVENLDSFSFEDLIGKPTAYTPKAHTHEYWQLYGMESTVIEIDRIADAHTKGTKALERENVSYGDTTVQKARDAIALYKTRVSLHINDFNNPHQTDKYKVGLDYINNWGMSTSAQAIDPSNVSTYMPVHLTSTVLDYSAIPNMRAHIYNMANPHGTTALMADCYNYDEVYAKFAPKLPLYAAAANSLLWGGRNKAQATWDIRSNLAATDVTTGRWPYNQLGYGYNPAVNAYEYALCGDGYWRHYSTLFVTRNAQRKEVYNAGSFNSQPELQAWLNAVHRWAPVNSLSFGHIRTFGLHPGNGNINPNVIYWFIQLWTKTAPDGGWVRYV